MPERTDHDYNLLDDAINTLWEWEEEIIEELANKGYGRSYFTQTMEAIQRACIVKEDE